MTLGALIAEFRRLVDDRGGYLLWSDEDAARFAVDAENEACIRARLLDDDTTAATCTVTLVPGQRAYTLHPSVFEVAAAFVFNDDGDILGERCGLARDDAISGIHTRITGGWPRAYTLRKDNRQLLLDREPPGDAELRLRVFRLPLVPMYAGTGAINMAAEPEIHWRHHDALPYWMAHKAFLTRDSDASASNRAQEFHQLFGARFGNRPDANVARKHIRHDPQTVQSAF